MLLVVGVVGRVGVAHVACALLLGVVVVDWLRPGLGRRVGGEGVAVRAVSLGERSRIVCGAVLLRVVVGGILLLVVRVLRVGKGVLSGVMRLLAEGVRSPAGLGTGRETGVV